MEETIETVNASDIFHAIELGDYEKQEFLDQYSYKMVHEDKIISGRSVFVFSLKNFIKQCEDIYEKSVMIEALNKYNTELSSGKKFINIEA
jgi:peroxiredoxin